jgi:hypothetical protein
MDGAKVTPIAQHPTRRQKAQNKGRFYVHATLFPTEAIASHIEHITSGRKDRRVLRTNSLLLNNVFLFQQQLKRVSHGRMTHLQVEFAQTYGNITDLPTS